MEEGLLTVDEIASILSIKPTTLHSADWKKTTGCPVFRLGKRLYALKTKFYEWIEQQRIEQQV